MANSVQRRLREMEEANPSLAKHSQNPIRYLFGRANLLFRRSQNVPQVKHIYSANIEENEEICRTLEVRDWARSNGRNLVYQMRPIRSIFSKDSSSATKEESEVWSREFQNRRKYMKELEEKPNAYREYAETGTLWEGEK
jgi:hypothetical protein